MPQSRGNRPSEFTFMAVLGSAKRRKADSTSMSANRFIDGMVSGLARVPVLSNGYRPFFLGAACWAVLSMVLSVGSMIGRWNFAAVYGAAAWHSHELLFGYGSAFVAGFLLAAIPAWTGRRPVRGGALLALILLWIAGRVAFMTLNEVGLQTAAVIDGLLPIVLAALALHEVVIGRNWRNVAVAALVGLFAVVNLWFHAEVFWFGVANYSNRAAIAVLIILISFIRDCVTPTFTLNWLTPHSNGELPTEFGRFDAVVIVAMATALLVWIAVPDGILTAVTLLFVGALEAVRMSLRAGAHTWRESLMLVLHISYAFVPLGFVLVGISTFWSEAMPPSAALHAWTTGAIGVVTLAVMTRASLGQTGMPFGADKATKIILVAAIVASFARVAAPLLSAVALPLLVTSLVGWIVAFGMFVLRYGGELMRPKTQG